MTEPKRNKIPMDSQSRIICSAMQGKGWMTTSAMIEMVPALNYESIKRCRTRLVERGALRSQWHDSVIKWALSSNWREILGDVEGEPAKPPEPFARLPTPLPKLHPLQACWASAPAQ